MPRRQWIAMLSLWPGLAQVWSGQEVLGLLLAAIFALTMNLAILTRFVWTEWLAAELSTFLVAFVGLYWLGTFAYTAWWLWRCHPQRYRPDIDRLFREASELYLQGRWNEARRMLEQILTLDETDADALMQLATLYARIDQPDYARRAFRQCMELEGGTKWRWEIAQELDRLNRLRC